MKRALQWLAILAAVTGCGASGADTPGGMDPVAGGTAGTGGPAIDKVADNGMPPNGDKAPPNDQPPGTTDTPDGMPIMPGTGGAPVDNPGNPADCGKLALDKSYTIASGSTLTLCAGTKIVAAADAQLIVAGKLVTLGSSDKPVVISGANDAINSWGGVVLMGGGSATLDYTELHGAKLPVDAKAGSDYAFTHLTVDKSTQAMDLAADGTISNSVFHGTGMATLRSPFNVNAASPVFTDTLLDKGGPFADMVDVSGVASSPVFDHVEISGVHCAIHMNQATDAVIKNSSFHDVAYGLMILGSTGSTVEHNNYKTNTTNIGLCSGGNAKINDNFFDSAAFDSTCSAQVNGSPATAALTDVGPR
jgi:hypothetical protein